MHTGAVSLALAERVRLPIEPDRHSGSLATLKAGRLSYQIARRCFGSSKLASPASSAPETAPAYSKSPSPLAPSASSDSASPSSIPHVSNANAISASSMA